MTEHCAYCDFDDYDVIAKNDFGVIFPEPHPLSKGHMVIVPLRHVSSFFDVKIGRASCRERVSSPV